MTWPHIDAPMTPVPIQPTRVLLGSALIAGGLYPEARCRDERTWRARRQGRARDGSGRRDRRRGRAGAREGGRIGPGRRRRRGGGDLPCRRDETRGRRGGGPRGGE